MNKLTKEEFYKLNRKQQISLLQSMEINFDVKDKEDNLYFKYEKYWEGPKPQDIVEKVIVKEEPTKLPLHLICPKCDFPLELLKRVNGISEYKCSHCGRGLADFRR